MSKLPKRPIKTLEDRVTHLLSEWLNDNAPIGEERYREPAKAVIKEVEAWKAQHITSEGDKND